MLSLLFFCFSLIQCRVRFMDRDGDGLLSSEDLFTASVLVTQRSEAFLKVRLMSLLPLEVL